MKYFRRLVSLSVIAYLMTSCGTQDPIGVYKGEIKDWAYEVFTGQIVSGGEEGKIVLTLRQTPDGSLATMVFDHPAIGSSQRDGKWEVGDGEREIRFNDGREPSEYYLIKRGLRFAFQTKAGVSNDDGSPVLLMRNEGLSRKASYPLKLEFKEGGEVMVGARDGEAEIKGQWVWSGTFIVVTAKMKSQQNVSGGDDDEETYKYFLEWDEQSEDLILGKMVILRPFATGDGFKRQNWMSSLKFKDKPRLSNR